MSTLSPLPRPSMPDADMRAAIDAIDDSFLVLDVDDRLLAFNAAAARLFPHLADDLAVGIAFVDLVRSGAAELRRMGLIDDAEAFVAERMQCPALPNRSEERSVGKECVSTCSSRWSPYPQQTIIHRRHMIINTTHNQQSPNHTHVKKHIRYKY